MRSNLCLWITIFFPILAFTQDCWNADLETGTLEGFTAYYGTINEFGQVILEAQGALRYRHDIMHVSEGFDTVALAHCEINRLLPVVPPNGGQYTLRLGNAISGAKAEKVVFRFTVTPDLTFFQLRYAVVLNDPQHAFHEQPRFELRISDQNNNIIPCGEYRVRAAEEIPDFESCREGWRVRPWTTVGFDLRDYIGQELSMEFLTSDCTKGAHAGYAYLEASCQRLEMNLEAFCPQDATTTASVTPGFKEYLWNTGATTPDVTINQPQTDFPYQVTITSATGCSFALEDQMDYIPPPSFEPAPNLRYCRDTQYWFTPQGTDLHSIYSPTLDISADSFLIGTDRSNYTFIATSPMGCSTDTLAFDLTKGPLALTSSMEELLCFGDQDGSLAVQSQTDFPPLQYQWNTGERFPTISDLSAGTYSVTITDAIHCTATSTFTINDPPELLVEPMTEQPISCYGMNDGIVSIQPKGGTAPYQFLWSASSRNTNTLDDLPPGNYEVTVVDANDCTTQYNTALSEPDLLEVEFYSSNITCFGGSDGSIELEINGGTPPYTIDWGRFLTTSEPLLEEIPADTYPIVVLDDRNCEEGMEVTLYEPSFHKQCGTYIPNAFSPNGDQQNDVFFVAASLSGIAIERMQIFNRWGQLVFENNGECPHIGDATCGWNGNISNTPAPAGVYVYLIQVQVKEHLEPILFSGEITLVR